MRCSAWLDQKLTFSITTKPDGGSNFFLKGETKLCGQMKIMWPTIIRDDISDKKQFMPGQYLLAEVDPTKLRVGSNSAHYNEVTTQFF